MRLLQRPRVPTAFGLWLRLALLALALLLWGLMAMGCAMPPSPPARADGLPEARAARLALYEKTLRHYLERGWLPFLDLGVSLADLKDPDRLIEGMDAAGVALAAVSAPDEDALWEAVRRHPGRLVPLTGEAPAEAWAGRPAEFREGLERRLGRGALGIGPIRAGRLAEGEESRPRLEALAALLAFAAGRRIPVVLDLPPADPDVGRLEKLLADHPAAQVVWTGAGHLPRREMNPGYGHALLRALSLRHANLSFALSTLQPPEASPVIRPQRNLLYDPGGRFTLEWGAVIDSRVGHFLTGSSPGAGSAAAYAARMKAYRRLAIESLAPASRPRVAYQNAWRLLAGEDWKE
ncbi:MAG: hypothetical protein HYZ11_04375 [Candidatus Tectomicrobia bacterium]|uniref:Uncharacterized protein n=1 Tax=Tectimicrobiota bacterium TaxID=2528274 RepID=A0A932MMS1_UNCTE|nr:hypothetical protein [Candidatus Tectomicrobia bacterium]